MQTGYDGSPIERWLDPTKDDLAETYFNHYTATFKAYQKLTETKILGENNDKYLTELYEINHRANFWLQGESCMSLSWKYWTATGNPYGYMNPTAAGRDLLTDEDYANMFLKVHANMKNDFGIETNNILLVRATQGVSSSENRELQLLTDINEIRAAQYYLGNNNPEIAIVSRISDIARMYTSNDKTSEGYGYMGVGNVHYNQIGHNANGVAAATNYFKALDADTNSSVRSVEIIDTNGRTRLGSDKVFEMEVNQTKRLAAMALPEYSRSDVKWESSNVNVATVDQYGLITAVDIGETTITATSDNGKSNSVKVVVYEVREININYRWDFNDLTETNGNNLSLSDLASATGNNYTIDKENGIYSTTSNLSDGERPDFTVEKPFTFDSEHNWSIEWRYFAKEGRAATLMGQTPIAENTSTLAGYIYLLYTTKWSESAGYPLRFVPQEGNVISLNYGDKRDLNTSMNTWRLSYDVSTKTMTLKVSVDNGITWDDVSSAKTGTFKTTITNLFGRQNAKGSGNFTGSVDYIDVKTVETVRVTEETN